MPVAVWRVVASVAFLMMASPASVIWNDRLRVEVRISASWCLAIAKTIVIVVTVTVRRVACSVAFFIVSMVAGAIWDLVLAVEISVTACRQSASSAVASRGIDLACVTFLICYRIGEAVSAGRQRTQAAIAVRGHHARGVACFSGGLVDHTIAASGELAVCVAAR